MSAENAYPGDDYVDFIGMDWYDHNYENISDQTQRFNYALTRAHGLNWLSSFAKSHGKRISIPEWGVGASHTGTRVDDATIVQLMHDWMIKNDVYYENYWNSESAYKGVITDLPNQAATYKKLFSAP
jgi:hypothetical protein